MNVLILMPAGPAGRHLAEAIELRGHKAELVSNTESAVTAYQLEDFRLVLMDVTCSLFDTFELCQTLRALPNSEEHLLIALTERDDPEHVSEILRAGFDDFLPDPSRDPERFQVRLQFTERRAHALESCCFSAQQDMTSRKRLEMKSQIDAQIQKALGSVVRMSLDCSSLKELLECTLDLLFSVEFVRLESKGAVYLVKEDDPGVLTIAAQRQLPAEVLASCLNVPIGCCLCGQAAARRETIFADCVDHQHERHYPGMVPHGHYCVPIVSGEELYGIMNLYVQEGHQQYEMEELFLNAVANSLANAIKRHRAERALTITEAELIAAEKIQQQLLPQSPPNLPAFDVHGVLVPAKFAAGDYFDYFNFADGFPGIVVGDVCGHGFSAALTAVFVQARLRSLTEIHHELHTIMDRANNTVAAQDTGFVTAILARLDPLTRTLWYINAGHPDGYVISEEGTVRMELKSNCLPLGVSLEAEFPLSRPIKLEASDLVVLLTDGVLEAKTAENELFGIEGTIATLTATRHKSARAITASLLAAVHEFSGRAEPHDDITAVVLKVQPS